MLVIDSDQWEKSKRDRLSAFCSSATAVLRSTPPAATRAFNDEELEAFVKRAVGRGRKFAILRNAEMLDWIQLNLEMGESFHHAPNFTWVQKVLEGARPGKVKRIRQGIRIMRSNQDRTRNQEGFRDGS